MKINKSHSIRNIIFKDLEKLNKNATKIIIRLPNVDPFNIDMIS
jgi:hypothetical protein